MVYRSPPFGMPPVVVGPNIRPQLKARLTNLLFTMHEDPEGRAALAELDIDRLVPADDAAYNAIREMEAFVKEMTQQMP